MNMRAFNKRMRKRIKRFTENGGTPQGFVRSLNYWDSSKLKELVSQNPGLYGINIQMFDEARKKTRYNPGAAYRRLQRMFPGIDL